MKNHMANSVRSRMVLLTAALLLLVGLGAGNADDYARVSGPCHLRFPEDHGAHPEYRTEWWYYTGNVTNPEGWRFGYQFTLFRFRLAPPGKDALWPDPPSKWRACQLFMGHAAVSDLDRKQYLRTEFMAREALGLAGVTEDENRIVVFLNQWRAQIGPDQHEIQADSDDFSLFLTLTPMKAPVLHGDKGYSRKGSTPERASCYYSVTRLKTEGDIIVKGARHHVEG